MMLSGAAFWTYDPDARALYFAHENRSPGPYKKQVVVEAIIDVADDGSLAGVEIIDPRMPPMFADEKGPSE